MTIYLQWFKNQVRNLLILPHKQMAKKAQETKVDQSNGSYWNKINEETQSKQSKLSMVLGALIILVAGVLVFNYFNKSKQDLGPAQQTTKEEADVSVENLPGNYTVKEGDTLFLIAEKYYQDGYKYNALAKENNLSDENSIEVGQVLQIPKTEIEQPAIGGGNTTIWGPKIEGETYTVTEGDWLSTIAARAYGDIMAYTKLAEANNISNPDLIEPGQVIKIPR
ncbi:MAG: LysM peptidoglycan-binding domain-containing protein [Candidatus Daviesbacteria bacterium]|nr:LysM peptidoglycan-binding domain-containing protein [Candidatus Daviesbacteria bacterium]